MLWLFSTKHIYKAVVMEHCLSKVKNLNGDREPPFPFFKFSFSCLRVCVCVFTYLFILFLSLFLILLTYYLSLLSLLFISFWYCYYSISWENEDSIYRKFWKRQFSNKTKNQRKKTSKQRQSKTITWPTTRGAFPRCSKEKVFWKCAANLQENIHTKVWFQ